MATGSATARKSSATAGAEHSMSQITQPRTILARRITINAYAEVLSQRTAVRASAACAAGIRGRSSCAAELPAENRRVAQHSLPLLAHTAIAYSDTAYRARFPDLAAVRCESGRFRPVLLLRGTPCGPGSLP